MNGNGWIAPVAAGLVAAAAGLFVPMIARGFNVIDRPGGHKQHARATPLLGGAALLLGWSVGLIVIGSPLGPWALAAVAACALGTVDDVREGGLAPGTKLLGQVAVVVLWIVLSGWTGASAAAAFVIVLFAINGFNLLDNADGLCLTAALGPLLGCVWWSMAWDSSAPAAGRAAMVFAAAVVGGFLWNLPRARVFLGDGGSHLVGFLVGALLVDLRIEAGAEPAGLLVVAAAFLLLPLLDTATVVVARVRRGLPPWVGDRRHLSHRLHRAGWREGMALLCLGLVSALGAGFVVLCFG